MDLSQKLVNRKKLCEEKFMRISDFALGIEVKILFAFSRQKDWNEKPARTPKKYYRAPLKTAFLLASSLPFSSREG